MDQEHKTNNQTLIKVFSYIVLLFFVISALVLFFDLPVSLLDFKSKDANISEEEKYKILDELSQKNSVSAIDIQEKSKILANLEKNKTSATSTVSDSDKMKLLDSLKK